MFPKNKNIGFRCLRFFLISMVVGAVGLSTKGQTRTSSFNEGWKFALGDFPAAKNAIYSDAKWRNLTLPHDWSIEGKFDPKNPAKPEGGGLPTGVAWYRKTFHAPANYAQRLIAITFDGVYKNSEVWINGKYLGFRPYGYSSFSYNIEKYLKAGRNTIAVRVDNSLQPDSRWYSGSGIYRNVWITNTAKTAIADRGTFVTTKNDGSVNIQTQLLQKTNQLERLELIYRIYKNGREVSRQQKLLSSVKDSSMVHSILKVTEPELWQVGDGQLYQLVVQLVQNQKVVDTYSTNFGFREFEFNAAKGFSINGKSMKIQGVCLHHDLGALGSAVNTRAIERQLEMMKAMGVNAIRTAHNPPAPELLSLCDKMGMLVMDEAFDMWVKKKNKNDYHLQFPKWHQFDLETMVKRDRNHPSVFMWSIGNEIREQFDSTGIALTKEQVKIVRDLDPTRPITSALTETKAEKNFIYQANALDVYGLNYNHKNYKDFPKNYPGVKFLGTETTSALETRGFYDTADTIRRWPKDGKTKFTEGNNEWAASAYDNVSAYWGSTHEETLKETKYDHVSGIFVWTGFDYLGEPLPYPWPARSSYFGIVDLAGFPKDSYYLYQSVWTDKPVLHLLPHWNWTAGQKVEVWAYYNNADEVELYLNGKSLGIKSKQHEELHVQWDVPFEAGTLKAVSRKNGREVLTKIVRTAGAAAKIELSVDRSQIASDGKDLSFVTVKITDQAGNLVPSANQLINFYIEGAGFIAGVDNGFQASLEPFKANYRKAYHGLALAIIQSNGKKGRVKLEAKVEGLPSATIEINAN